MGTVVERTQAVPFIFEGILVLIVTYIKNYDIISIYLHRLEIFMKLDLSQIKSITFGAVSVTEENGEFSFYRFTEEQSQLYPKYRSPDYFARTFTTAGVRFSFETDSTCFSFDYSHKGDWSVAYSYFDIYVDGVIIGHFGLDHHELGRHAEVTLPEGNKRVEVYFPWSKPVTVSNVTLDDGADVKPIKRDKVAINYGDSITHGYFAEYPSLTYASRISRMLGLDSYNKAIGGDKFFPEILELDEPIEPEIVTVAYGTNDWQGNSRADLTRFSREYLKKLSEKYPKAKIFVISPIWRTTEYSEIFGGACTAVHGILAQNTSDLDNITLINGWNLTAHNEKFYMDGVHPNDLGFSIYAENLYREISKFL